MVGLGNNRKDGGKTVEAVELSRTLYSVGSLAGDLTFTS